MARDRSTIVSEILKRRTAEGGLYPSAQEAAARLAGDEPLLFYCGYDPTGDIHIGHLVTLLLLKSLTKELGHRTIVLFGDFTARIGDPTGKESVRRALTEEEIQTNMTGWDAQIAKIFGDVPYTIQHNSEWLSSMTFGDVIRLSAKVTVQQMLARDMFQTRLKNERPIYLNEFLYPLAQGYDSVAMRVDGEVGGSEQTFNMLVGREFSRELLGKDKLVLTTPLILNARTGKKMSKSEGDIIAISDTPQEIRRKALDFDDGVVELIFRLCTEKPTEWIEEHAKGDPRQFKEELAAELIRIGHGDTAVGEAVQAEVISVTGQLDHVLKESGLASSLGEAKRLVEQGAVQVNGERITRWDTTINSGDKIQVGKGKFVRVA